MTEGAVTSSAVARGEELLAAHRYDEARQAFETAVGESGDPEALVGLATVSRVLDDVPAATAALERAYRIHLDVGQPGRAAADAVTLADLALEHQGAASVAKGWLTRAGQHLAPVPDDPAQVHVAGLEAYIALAYDKDPVSARQHAQRSVQVAERLGRNDAVVMGNAYLGIIEVSLGQLDLGMRRLEGSVAAAAAGELPPAETLDTYCLLVTACERVRDVERVREWAERVLALAEEQGSDGFAAFARTRYANTLLLRGEWDAADHELERVLRDSESRPVTAAMGLVLRSKLRRLQGRLDEADEVLATAEREPYRRGVRHLVLEARAALELARGDVVGAADLAERYLRMVTPADVIERVDALETLVRSRLAEGDTDRARTAADELAATARLIPTPGVRGASLAARGLLATAASQTDAAVASLQDAAEEFDRAGLAYDAADARIALAGALRDAGRAESARREVEQGTAEAVRLGAALLADAGRRTAASLRPGSASGDLTAREAEVLRLAGSGLANAEIADRLVLSVRTVERHLSNVYLKVGATGPAARSIAIAYGREHGLL